MIPKIIFQTWKTHEIPLKWLSGQESIRQYMPDWLHIIMDDVENREFIKTYFYNFLPYYDAFKYPIQRADAIRYAFLYIHGGLYIDMDYEFKNNVNYIIENSLQNKGLDVDVFLAKSETHDNFYKNSIIISKPGCILWLMMIEHMKTPNPWSMIFPQLGVALTTGSLALTKQVKLLKSTDSTFVFGELPRSQVNPCTICDNEKTCEIKNMEADIIQLSGSTWCSNIFNTTCIYVYCNRYWIIVTIILIIISICIYAIIKWPKKT